MRAFAPTRIEGPAEALLSLEDAKIQCRVDGSSEDDLITALVAGAEAHLDGYAGVLGRALVTQTWEQKFDSFPADRCLRLPLGNLQAATVTYYDGSNQSRTFTDFTAVSDAIGPMLILPETATWPTTYDRPDAVTVEWECGYGTVENVPASIIHAVRLLVAHWYDNRVAVTSGAAPSVVPMAVDMLLAPYRMVGI